MDVTFFSNFLNHHQLPFCLEMKRLIGPGFRFVATEPISKERLELGYKDIDAEYDFCICSYKDQYNYDNAIDLGRKSDVVIVGSAPERFVSDRIREDRRLTFRYSERIFKRGPWSILHPKNVKRLFLKPRTYGNKRLYMLCASAYTASDFAFPRRYFGKTYKWGYFPEAKNHNLSSLFLGKDNNKVQLLWVGRLVDYKKASDAIAIAERLDKAGYDFNLNIVGIGPCESALRRQIIEKRLADRVYLLGRMHPESVRNYMEHTNIFLITSDYNEGWGAVLNESMNSGCAVVASHAIGSAPYLIRDGHNGLIYEYGNKDMFYERVKYLFDYPHHRDEMGQKAYETIVKTWNAEVAAERLLTLCNEILSGDRSPDLYEDGPCSRAEIIKNNWFKEGE